MVLSLYQTQGHTHAITLPNAHTCIQLYRILEINLRSSPPTSNKNSLKNSSMPVSCAVMQHILWLLEIVLPSNVNHWVKIISCWSSVTPRVKWKAGLSSGGWLHLKVWQIITHKHSLRKKFAGWETWYLQRHSQGELEDLAKKVVITVHNILDVVGNLPLSSYLT